MAIFHILFQQDEWLYAHILLFLLLFRKYFNLFTGTCILVCVQENSMKRFFFKESKMSTQLSRRCEYNTKAALRLTAVE